MRLVLRMIRPQSRRRPCRSPSRLLHPLKQFKTSISSHGRPAPSTGFILDISPERALPRGRPAVLAGRFASPFRGAMDGDDEGAVERQIEATPPESAVRLAVIVPWRTGIESDPPSSVPIARPTSGMQP